MRSIPDPGFAGDDGRADPAVSAALRAYADDPRRGARAALIALQGSRLLVPVVAVAAETEEDDDGLRRESRTDMASVLMTGRDGRTALLAFTGQEALHAWDADARPVPVSVAQAAEAALADGAAALLVDVAGPVMIVVETADLQQLAQGRVLVELSDGYGWARPVR